jgi:hypothetical protein
MPKAYHNEPISSIPFDIRTRFVHYEPVGSKSERKDVIKSNVTHFAVVLLMGLAGSLAGATSSLIAAPQRHDQVPGFYRLKVGDLEVTALYDGAGAFDLHWLNGKKAPIDVAGRQWYSPISGSNGNRVADSPIIRTRTFNPDTGATS